MRKDDWITQLHIQEELNKKDFYLLDGKKVMTKSYHIKRGICCGNSCLNCPYDPKAQKGNTILKQIKN